MRWVPGTGPFLWPIKVREILVLEHCGLVHLADCECAHAASPSLPSALHPLSFRVDAAPAQQVRAQRCWRCSKMRSDFCQHSLRGRRYSACAAFILHPLCCAILRPEIPKIKKRTSVRRIGGVCPRGYFYYRALRHDSFQEFAPLRVVPPRPWWRVRRVAYARDRGIHIQLSDVQHSQELPAMSLREPR